jgi:hypothetical protein
MMVPLDNSVLLTAPTEFPQPEFALRFRRLDVSVAFVAENPFEVESQPAEARWCRSVSGLRFQVLDVSRNEKLANAIAEEDDAAIVQALTDLVNYVIRALRAVGLTHSLPEINLESGEPSYFLSR